MSKAGNSWVNRNKWLLLSLIIGGAARLLTLVLLFSDLESDPDAYKQIAVNVSSSGVYGQTFGDRQDERLNAVQPTAFRPPLYPLILSLIVRQDANGKFEVSKTGIVVIHFGLGLLTILLTFWVGQNFKLTDPGCLLLSMLVAFDPICLRQSALPMTETLAVALAALGIWLFSRQGPWQPIQFFAVGLVLGMFSMCRPTFLIWAGLVFLWIATGPQILFDRAKTEVSHASFLFLIGVILSISPWTIRNYQVFGKAIFATSHGGYTIYLGNNDSFYDYLRSGRQGVWDGEKELAATIKKIRDQSLKTSGEGNQKVVDEVKKDRLYYEKALDTMGDRPGDFLYACWIRVIRFWSIWPKSSGEMGSRQKLIQFGSAIWYAVVFVMAIAGVGKLIYWSARHKGFRQSLLARLVPAAMLVLAFQGLHLLYWSNMRMRAPLVALIALLAVMSLTGGRWVRNWTDESKEN